MESLEERKIKIRSKIGTCLDVFEHLFTQELAERLSECRQSFAAEKAEYHQEIDALRTKVARIQDLEDKNGKLIAELESANQRCKWGSLGEDDELQGEDDPSAPGNVRREGETVDIKEYNRVKEMLARSDEDYGKVVFARQVLESKLRHYKDMTKQWREYTDRWILKYPKKQPKSLSASKSSPNWTAQGPASSSAPAPPSIPDGISPSVSDISRSVSPWIRADLQSHDRSPEMLPKRIIATQMALKLRPKASSEDLTEGSEEPESRKSGSLEAPHERLLGTCVQNAAHLQNEADDSPTVVSENPVNRKRHISVHEHCDSQNPSSVKDEQRSSSPLPASTSLNPAVPHDSLDLDDVGGHIDTPRKRRKMELIGLGSPRVFSEANVQTKDVSEDKTKARRTKTFAIKDENDENGTANGLSTFCLSPTSPRNRRNREDEEQIRRPRKASSRAQQQAHNNRVQERLINTLQAPEGDGHPKRSFDASGPQNDTFITPSSQRPNAYPTPRIGDHPHPHKPQGHQESVFGKSEPTTTPAILQPIDANARILPRTNGKVANQKPLRTSCRQDQGAAYVLALAEDGDNSPSASHKARLSPDKHSKAPDAHHRLGALLSGPSPEKSLLENKLPRSNDADILPSSNTPVTRPSRYRGSKVPVTPLSEPAKRSLVEDDARRQTDFKHYRNTQTVANQGGQSFQATNNESTINPSFRSLHSIDPTPEDRPEHEPLRARPFRRLRIDDFKLNPAHCDYAYHESVRKHDEKKSMSGCTDRNCLRCKDIRKFVESSGYVQISGKNIVEADRRLIEDYVGGDRRRVDKLSAEEKKEILIQAKIKEFADKFGKHRTNFGRAVSPVDYWNTDFPTTQQHEQNREAARAREREKVEMMYWEAMRKDGKYIFADE